jgi:uncharacterized membrane protein YraQ (UPF0718 family)/regulator of protease activity HflC (stomatin/prohibitin superfamily)
MGRAERARVMAFLESFVREASVVLYEGSLYLLLGFVVAGILHEFVPAQWIARHLGSDTPRAVGLAALFGAPVPLCSCGVLPAAAELHRRGVGRAPLTSFLISTPETGVDSVALTWGLFGPLMAVIRPVVAVVTALVAGLLCIGVRDEADGAAPPPESHAEPAAHAHDHDVASPAASPSDPVAQARRVLHHAFVTLLDDLAFWLAVGIALTGLLGALLPDDFFSSVLGWDRGLVPLFAMLVIGIPLYLCASASTPVAAGLVAKGLSPGAALVLLLAGPATNAATIAVVARLLGARRLRIYLGSVVATSLAAGLAVDLLFADVIRAATLTNARGDPWFLAFAKLLASVALVVLLAASFRRTRFRASRAEARDQARGLVAWVRSFDARSLLRPPVLALAAAAALALLLPRAVLEVGPGERGVIQRFGRVVASDLPPGLHWHLPPPLGRGLAVEAERVREVTVGFVATPQGERLSVAAEGLYLTADENLIDLRSVVHFRVSDAARFALGVERVETLVRALARRELVRVASGTTIDAIYTRGRRPTEAAFEEGLRARVRELAVGCEIVDALLLDVHAPASVHDAFRDVASSVEDRERAIHEARGERAEREADAAGSAASQVEAARAEAARTQALAAGAGAAFHELAEAHAASPAVVETRLGLGRLEGPLAATRKLVHPARGGADVDLWLGAAALEAPDAAALSETGRAAPVPLPLERFQGGEMP